MKIENKLLLVLAVLCSGCAAARDQVASLTGRAAVLEKKSEETARKEARIGGWDWATGIPSGVTSGDVVAPKMPSQAVALLAPEFAEDGVQLASATEPSASVSVDSVNGIEVRNYTRLSALIQTLARGKDAATVTLSDGREAEIQPANLTRVLHGTAREHDRIRVTEDGNPWVIMRDHGTRCKIFPRVERDRGMLQLVLSLQQLWGDDRVLPGNVRVFCDGELLECLTAAQTLALLYDDPSKSADEDEARPKVVNFSEVASLESYVVPTNYKRLAAKYEEDTRMIFNPPEPALISVPGLTYPGPAILGDARALGGYLLTPALYKANGPEKTGWVMFQGDTLKDGGRIRVEIQLDENEASVCEFDIPSAE